MFAQEDETVDDIVDVEGEEASVQTEDEFEEETATASADADTTILFTKPVHTALSTLGMFKKTKNYYFFIIISIIMFIEYS